MDNLLLGPDAQVNHQIGLLRAILSDAPLVDGASPVPGIHFSIDTEGDIAGNYATGGDGLLRLNYSAAKPPRWLGLHLAIDGSDLDRAAVFGVVCKSRAPEAATFRLCLRSGTPSGFVDAFLPKHVVSFSESSTHIDLLKLQGHDTVPANAVWRELVLFFPPKSGAFEISDLRVFIV